MLAGGALGATLGESLFDAVAFGDRAASSLSDARVAAYAADRVTDAVLRESPDLMAVRPLLVATAEGLLGSDAMRGIVRGAARSAHAALFAEGTQQVVLSVPDVGLVLRGVLERATPELASRIPPEVAPVLASLARGDSRAVEAMVWLVGLRDHASPLVYAALGLGALLLAAGAAGARDRRAGVAHAGAALLAAGGLLLLVGSLGRALIRGVAEGAAATAALEGLWDTLLIGLGDWALLLGGLGLLFAAAGTSLLDAFEPAALAGRLRRVVAAEVATSRGRLVAGGLLLACGGFALGWPLAAATAFARALGAVAFLVGARVLFRLVLDQVEATPAFAALDAEQRSRGRVLVLSGVALALAAGLLLLRNPASVPPPSSVSACNGSPSLCSRRLDEVVFAGAHNAMSNAGIRDWMFPHHDAPIEQQLRDGVRALLIDVHPGFPGGSRIKTDLSGMRPTLEALSHAIGDEGVEAAQRIRDRLVGVDEGRRGLYLCHGFCEVGAYELVPTLAAVRHFLVEQPGSVLLLVVEDYVAPAELALAFDQSGLLERVYRGPSGARWPRLRDLVAAGANVVVFIESGEPGVDWLRPAFELIQETPFTFHAPEEFSCAPNRGGTGGTLFQINHWIETTPAPRPTNAELVNAGDVLGARAARCRQERGLLPNVLAVDFYGRGDLLEVVAELNGRR